VEERVWGRRGPAGTVREGRRVREEMRGEEGQCVTVGCEAVRQRAAVRRLVMVGPREARGRQPSQSVAGKDGQASASGRGVASGWAARKGGTRREGRGKEGRWWLQRQRRRGSNLGEKCG
jgi:hypothetical protein